MTTVMHLDPIDARPEWLDHRRRGIGGSDIAALCGMSRFATPMSVYLDKIGMLDDSDAGEAALWGRLLETPIAWEFENRTGLHVAGAQLCVVDQRADWRRATLDGLVVETDARYTDTPIPADEMLAAALGTFESKASSQFGFDDGIPDEYAVQCQWQMGITGLTAGWLAILHNGRRLVIEELEFDPSVFDGLAEIADRFWHDHILARNPPPVDSADATTQALKDAYRERAQGTAVELSDDVALIARGLLPARAAVKKAQAELDLIENEIRAALGDHTVGTYAGEELVTWKAQNTAARFDVNGLRAAHPELVEKFMGEKGTTRVLRPTKALKEAQ